tara:strand:+ start:49 stop:405 length:357 start_codon:yes stop_codon:yes gene_type:complete
MSRYSNNNELNNTEYDNDRDLSSDGIVLILCLSFCQFSYYSLNRCFKKIKESYRLNKKIKKINGSDLENLINECSICLEEYKINEKIMILDCDHIYHKECINLWLNENHNCPICRENI